MLPALLCLSSASVGVCSAKRVSVQQGEPHLPSLASRGSKVWPYVPESCRCHLFWERAADRHRQAWQRYKYKSHIKADVISCVWISFRKSLAKPKSSLFMSSRLWLALVLHTRGSRHGGWRTSCEYLSSLLFDHLFCKKGLVYTATGPQCSY